jgi:hypothetical protein
MPAESSNSLNLHMLKLIALAVFTCAFGSLKVTGHHVDPAGASEGKQQNIAQAS